MTRATDRRAVLGAVLAAGAVGATAIPAVAKPALGEDAAYRRALALWNRWLKQNERYDSLSDDRTVTQETLDSQLDVLTEIEDGLHDAMGASVHALAAVLMIEMGGGCHEDVVEDIMLASLAAIRHQLVGAIAEEADRVLAEEEEDA